MELSVVVDVITAIAVTLGILLGLVQLRHYHLSQRWEAALFLLNSFQTGEFLEGIWRIQGLPNGLSKNEIEDIFGKDIRFIYLVMSTWDRIGFLVFKHEISIDMVEDVYSGQIIFSWRRLEKFVSDLRKELQRETPFEWFQWLAERMIDREKAEAPIPAYRAYRDWE